MREVHTWDPSRGISGELAEDLEFDVLVVLGEYWHG